MAELDGGSEGSSAVWGGGRTTDERMDTEARQHPPLSHTTADGRLHMVDVAGKASTARSATATSVIHLRGDVLDALIAADLPKGDALAAARVAGVLAAKRTADWIPLCHPLPLDWVNISFARVGRDELLIAATVKTTAPTGVEMEALTAASAAALTLYDMAKSADKGIVIGPTQLEIKRGGKSGEYRRRGQSS